MDANPEEIPSAARCAGDGTQQTGPQNPPPPAREGEFLPAEHFSALAARFPKFFGGENRAQIIAHVLFRLEQEKRELSSKIEGLQSNLESATKNIHALEIERATTVSQTRWRPAAAAGGLLLVSTVEDWRPSSMGFDSWIVFLIGLALAIYGLWPQRGKR